MSHTRVTIAVYTTGTISHVADDWTKSENKQRQLDGRWTGVTRFAKKSLSIEPPVLSKDDSRVIPGESYSMSAKAKRRITQLLSHREWPDSRREAVEGKGTCLGATFGQKGPMIGRDTSQNEDLCRVFNTALERTFGNKKFF